MDSIIVSLGWVMLLAFILPSFYFLVIVFGEQITYLNKSKNGSLFCFFLKSKLLNCTLSMSGTELQSGAVQTQ